MDDELEKELKVILEEELEEEELEDLEKNKRNWRRKGNWREEELEKLEILKEN
ncbi:hypothetical protein HPP92_010222 [Vanilla planifolia]|uniref:Uncharacterized protein n=1 Tax=Vanilla planifolia TaxID=51239 RepID=A0A835V2A0_VANPL|nr:hypothetical protein HPP92_010222 [Vanilla planifolia]